MLTIAGGIILAVLGLMVLRFVYEVLFVPIPRTRSAGTIINKKERIIEEGQQKHADWEKKHPFAKHLYKYDRNKYLAKNRSRDL